MLCLSHHVLWLPCDSISISISISWRSPMHPRVDTACRTATQQRTEVSKEDERQWDWTRTVNRSCEGSVEREQQQEPSALNLFQRKPSAATERSRNQADGSLLNQGTQQQRTESAACSVVPSSPAASGILLCGMSDRPQCGRSFKGLPSKFFSHVTLTDSCHFHIVVSRTTLLFPAPHFDNPTTPLIARRHTKEFR